VDLPAAEETEPEPEPEISLDSKRAEFKWPADAATRFSPEVLDSYLVDHVLTETERRVAALLDGPQPLRLVEREP
jgi:hypothetical protein